MAGPIARHQCTRFSASLRACMQHAMGNRVPLACGCVRTDRLKRKSAHPARFMDVLLHGHVHGAVAFHVRWQHQNHRVKRAVDMF